MVEYHDILFDIGYAKTYQDAFENSDNLYRERPPMSAFLDWRDLRVLDEVHWYGWFIDYWMEDGLMRDMFSHKVTSPEHWNMLMQPLASSRDDLLYENFFPNGTVIVPSRNPHCINDVSLGCHPVAVISAERLVQHSTGPGETKVIGNVLLGKPGISDYLIEQDAWDCIWDELIVKKKGVKTFLDRGTDEHDYNFSAEMLVEMVHELNRMITKYSEPEWSWRQTSQKLVSLFNEHLLLIEAELAEIQSGRRKLTPNDFLGPETRKKMNVSQRLAENGNEGGITEVARELESKKEDYSEYFRKVETQLFENRKGRMKKQAMDNERRLQRKLAGKV